MMKNQKGITLIALVITIIVLLILAGVSIAMLTGENSIITNAQKSKSYNAYASAKDQMGLAYMSVRTEISSKMGTDTTYNAITSINDLKAIVESDLGTGDWEVTVKTDGDSNKIIMKYVDTAIDKGFIDTDKPRYDGYVIGEITVTEQSASFAFDTVESSL